MQLEKDTLDNYKPGRVIPYFPLSLKLIDLTSTHHLSQKVTITGIEPRKSITLSRDLEPPVSPEGWPYMQCETVLILLLYYVNIQLPHHLNLL